MAPLGDLEPGAERDGRRRRSTRTRSASRSRTRSSGQVFFGEASRPPTIAPLYIRHSMVDQLTYDPMFGSTNSSRPTAPVILAWGSDACSTSRSGPEAAQLGNVLYYVPAGSAISGTTTFRSDLIRSTVVDVRRRSSSPRTVHHQLRRGRATIAYRPIAFEGTLTATELAIAPELRRPGLTIEPSRDRAAAVDPAAVPGSADRPKVRARAAFFGRPAGGRGLRRRRRRRWKRLPHLAGGHALRGRGPGALRRPGDRARVLVRFVNDRIGRRRVQRRRRRSAGTVE